MRLRAFKTNLAAGAAFAAAVAFAASSASARPIGQAGDRAEAEAATMTVFEKAVVKVREVAAKFVGADAPTREPAQAAASAPVAETAAAPIAKPVAEPVAQLRAADPAKAAKALRAIGDIPTIERLSAPTEERLAKNRYALSAEAERSFDRFVPHALESPDGLSPAEFASLTRPASVPEMPKAFHLTHAGPKSPFSRAPVDALSVALTPETPFHLGKYSLLSQDEFRFLSGLLLYQRGDKCAVAAGLFHKFAQAPGAQGQANYYLAMCAKQLNLEGEFFGRAKSTLDSGSTRYAAKIVKELPAELPDDSVVAIGAALFRYLGAKGDLKLKLDAPSAGNARYWLAQFGSRTGRYKTALANAAEVPEGHAKRLQAQFLLALAQHELGDRAKALQTEEEIAKKAETASTREFAATAALNLARMQFQEKKFKEASLNFLKVYKDHPQWLQSLNEMGWAQLQNGDYEGAIGNMYSVQSPYFKAVYKPESYVIRTIGYLDLCQYGDAYRTLTKLERQYRPWLDKMDEFASSKAPRTEAVRSYIASGAKAEGEGSGLPGPVLREMARHKDYLNQQKALNSRIDERARYARLSDATERALAQARAEVTATRKQIAETKAKIASIAKNPQLEPNRLQWKAELEREFDALNDRFFEIDVMNEAKSSIAAFAADATKNADQRLVALRAGIERMLTVRLNRMREDLRQILDNNELLRYEVFAGSGENLRFQIAGGAKGNRLPASVLPQSKSLRWDFDGEYWEDEVGHFRSSLKNNCPDSSIRGQARLEGGEEEAP